jgi:hypothetical protein
VCDNAKGGVYQLRAASDGVDEDTYVGGNMAQLMVPLKHLECAGGAEEQAPVKVVWTALIRFIVERALATLIERARTMLPVGYVDAEGALRINKLRRDTQITFHVPGQAHDNIHQFIRGCFAVAFGGAANAVLGGPFNPLDSEVDSRRLTILTEARSALQYNLLVEVGVENITAPLALLMLDLGGACWLGGGRGQR